MYLSKQKILIYLLFLINTAMPAFAGQNSLVDTSKIVELAATKKLYTHPTWLKLLKYIKTKEGGFRSDIMTNEFFISKNGSSDPEKELSATINALFGQFNGVSAKHPQCQFPARYFWIKSQLDISQFNQQPVYCERLEKWAKFPELKSISLVMVSGYFGNPASTFGHIVIKLNNSGPTDNSNLLDLGVNYGALVPPKEPTLVYIAKGLFGGYVGGFSDQKFYTQDAVYSEAEYRDMWEYELNLSDDERRMFVYHVWELVGKKYVYYFLKENCAYQVKDILETVINKSFSEKSKFWYLPMDLFYSLADEVNNRNEPFIKEIRFIPSSQRLLYQEFRRLDRDEAVLANRLIKSPELLESPTYDSLTNKSKLKILDVLLAYYKYRIAAYNDDDVPPEFLLNKRKLLSFRLALPINDDYQSVKEKAVPEPSKGSKPGVFRVGAVYNDELDGVINVGFAAVYYDSVGNVSGSLEHSELKIFDMSLFIGDDDKTELDRLDLISIQKLDLSDVGIEGENRHSWRVGLGAKRDNFSCVQCLVAYIEGGIGKALALGSQSILYGFLDGGLQSKFDSIYIGPSMGFIYKYNNNFKSQIELSGLYTNKENKKLLLSFETRYSISRDSELRFKIARDEALEYGIGVNFYW